MKINKLLALPLILIATVTFSFGQVRISSPYSYYGIGQIFKTGTPINNSMGGLHIGLRTKGLINPGNPASYTSIDTNTFIFDIGLSSNFNQLRNKEITQDYTNYSTINHLLMSFSATRWMGITVGLLPFSQTGYKIVLRDTLPDIGQVEESFDGAGGINQVFIGAGFRIKNLSLGANLGYLFGTTDKAVSVYTTDLSYYYDIRKLEYQSVSSIFLSYGVQYEKIIKQKYFLSAGAKFNLPSKLSATRSQLCQRFTVSGDVESIKDTLFETEDEKGKIQLPLMLGGGLVFGQKNYWLVGADFDWQNWKSYRNFGESDSLKNCYNISIGTEFNPKTSASSNYWKKMSYRMGFHFGTTNISLQKQTIHDMGLSIGMSFPLSKLRSQLNFSAEIGRMGNTDHNLMQENYVRFTLGFNFKEFWFYRPKLR